MRWCRGLSGPARSASSGLDHEIDSIHQTASGQVPPGRVLGLLAQPRIVAMRDDGLALIVGPADFAGLDLAAERQADGLLNVAEPAIVAGALALFVVSRSVFELVGVTRTLLRHSSNRVYTREVPEQGSPASRIDGGTGPTGHEPCQCH